MTVTVYHIGPTCVQCNQTKNMMKRLDIPFNEVDLRENPDIAERFKEQGHLTAPIVTVGEKVWSGFRFERIKDLAKQVNSERAHGN